MRVLLISPTYEGGGAERCARELFEELPKHGVQAELWVAHPPAKAVPNVHGMRKKWEYLFSFLDAFPHWTDGWHLGSIRRLDAVNPAHFDVVHFHNLHSGCVSIQAAYRLCQRMPVIWTLHDEWAIRGGINYDLRGKILPAQVKQLTFGPFRYLPYHPYHDNFRLRGVQRFLRRWLPQPAGVVCPSAHLARLVGEHNTFPHSRVDVVPNGLKLLDEPACHSNRQAARATLGIPAGEKVVLLVAAQLTNPAKGMLLGVEAVNNLASRADLRLLLLGKGLELLRPHVKVQRVTGFYAGANAALAQAYRAADVTVIPSLDDNFPFVALESLACATPLVTFRVGGLAEIVGQNERGIAVEPYEMKALSAAIEQLLTNSEHARHLGRQGQAWVTERCSLDRFVTNMLKLYEAVSERKP